MATEPKTLSVLRPVVITWRQGKGIELEGVVSIINGCPRFQVASHTCALFLSAPVAAIGQVRGRGSRESIGYF